MQSVEQKKAVSFNYQKPQLQKQVSPNFGVGRSPEPQYGPLKVRFYVEEVTPSHIKERGCHRLMFDAIHCFG
jgi:hypothetical protein